MADPIAILNSAVSIQQASKAIEESTRRHLEVIKLAEEFLEVCERNCRDTAPDVSVLRRVVSAALVSAQIAARASMLVSETTKALLGKPEERHAWEVFH